MKAKECGSRIIFECPGCKYAHGIDPARWSFNGDFENPTFSPSVLVRFGENRDPRRCHSYVTGGRIKFLNDCTHELAGKTVDLPDMDEGAES